MLVAGSWEFGLVSSASADFASRSLAWSWAKLVFKMPKSSMKGCKAGAARTHLDAIVVLPDLVARMALGSSVLLLLGGVCWPR